MAILQMTSVMHSILLKFVLEVAKYTPNSSKSDMTKPGGGGGAICRSHSSLPNAIHS